MRAYVHTYIRIYIHTYVFTYIHTYILVISDEAGKGDDTETGSLIGLFWQCIRSLLTLTQADLLGH